MGPTGKKPQGSAPPFLLAVDGSEGMAPTTPPPAEEATPGMASRFLAREETFPYPLSPLPPRLQVVFGTAQGRPTGGRGVYSRP